MRVLFIILYVCLTHSTFGSSPGLLSVKYKSYKKEGVWYYVFKLKSEVDEDLFVQHLSCSQFTWQVPYLVDGRTLIHVQSDINPIGYAIVGKHESIFVLRSDRNIIRGSDGIGGKPYISLAVCRFSQFKKEGYKAMEPVQLDLIIE